MLAPIALFVYNRPWHTRQTVEALLKNELASDSELFIFADGPRIDANAEQIQNIKIVRDYIHGIVGFKTIKIIESSKNKGLANSIIEGVTEIVNKYGKIIVLEDDIVTNSFFLTFMNKTLDIYKEEDSVMQVSAFMYPIRHNNLPDTFFYQAASCWGWATWKRAWRNYYNNPIFLYNEIKKRGLQRILNINNIHNYEEQLVANINGTLNTWFIRWNASIIIANGLTLYPKYTLVENIGFDGTGEHCNSLISLNSKYNATHIKIKKQKIKPSKRAIKKIQKYNKQSFLEKIIGFLLYYIRKIWTRLKKTKHVSWKRH